MNLVSGGATLVAMEGDRDSACAIVGPWPTAEYLAFFGLTQEDADAFHEVFNPVAERLGLHYAWRREGDRIELTFARDALQ